MRAYTPLLALAALLAGARPAAALEGWTGESALTALSDYRWRGASMSEERPAVQAGAGASHEGGLWFWVGGGSVAESYGGAELGAAAGWAGEAAGFAWEIGAEYTAYPDQPAFDYHAISAQIARGISAVTLSAGFEYAPAQANLDEDDRYAWAGLAVQTSQSVRAHARVGKNSGAFAAADGVADFEAGVTLALALAGVDVDVAHVGSDVEAGTFVLSLTARR